MMIVDLGASILHLAQLLQLFDHLPGHSAQHRPVRPELLHTLNLLRRRDHLFDVQRVRHARQLVAQAHTHARTPALAHTGHHPSCALVRFFRSLQLQARTTPPHSSLVQQRFCLLVRRRYLRLPIRLLHQLAHDVHASVSERFQSRPPPPP